MGTLAQTRVGARLGLLWELYHPAAMGLAAAFAYALFGAKAMTFMVANGWQIGSIYSSVFDLASVFTAFLFTFYTFVVTTDRGFIGRMKGTRAYGLLKRYAVHALMLGGATIVGSVPLMVVEPKPTSGCAGTHFVVAVLSGLAVWTVLAFVRAARLFVEFLRQHD